MLLGHLNQSYALAFGRMFERAGYYGIRALIVLFAIEKFHIPRQEALTYYGSMTLLTYITMPFAGVISDLLKANKWVLMGGGILQIIGILLIMSAQLDNLFTGGILFAVGSGAYTIASMSAFGRLHFGKLATVFSGWTKYYALVNLGAFVGIWFSSYYVDIHSNFNIVFTVAIVASTIGTILAFLNVPPAQNIKKNHGTSLGLNSVLIILAVLTSVIFWTCYENFGGTISFWSYQVTEALPGTDPLFTLNLSSYVTVGMGALFFFLWGKFKINSLKAIAVALLIAAGAIFILRFEPKGMDNLYYLLITHTVLISVTEILIVPLLLGVQNIYSNPKYLGIIYGGILLTHALLNRYMFEFLDPALTSLSFKWQVMILSGTLLLLTLIWFAIQFFAKHRFTYEYVDSANDKELQLKEGEILD